MLKGIDISNYGGEISASAFAKARDDFDVRFVRVGAQDARASRMQLDAIAEAGGLEVDCIYVTTPFQLDGALNLARDYNVRYIAVDVEEGCFETQPEIDNALARIAGTGVEPLIYTRVSYWQPGNFIKPTNVRAWVAWYLGGNQEPNADNSQYVTGLADDNGLGPVETWQYHGTIELVPGLTCDLNARLDGAQAEAGPVVVPSSPATVPVGGGPATPTGPRPIAHNPTQGTPPPAEDYDNAPGGFRLTQALPYAYLEFCGVGIVRFGGAETDDNGQPLYPGRMAFLRGDTYLYLRASSDGNLYLSPDEGE